MSKGMYSILGSRSELEAPGLVSAGNLKANFRGGKNHDQGHLHLVSG